MTPTIELGEMRHGEEVGPPPDPPRPSSRSLRIAALCSVVLLTLAGAAPTPVWPRPVLVPAPQGATFLVVGDRLVVADGPNTVGGDGRLVAAYRLPGGEPLWRLGMPGGDHVLGVGMVAGTLLVSSSPAGAGDPTSTAVDIDTGRVRWREPGYPLPTQDGRLLFARSRPDGTWTLRLVDPASGSSRWSLPMPSNGAEYRFGDRGVAEIVLLTVDGRVEIRDPGSGGLLRAGRVPSAADGVSYRFNQVVGDLLLLDDGAGWISGYGLERLDRRWTIPVDLRTAAYFQDCGHVICLRDRDARLRLIDPATGRSRWTGERWFAVFPVGDRLLAAEAGVGPEPELVALDPATGRRVGRLGRWQLAGPELSGQPLIGLRRLPGDRELVAELDVAAGQVRVRDVLPGAWNDCAVVSATMVCQRPAGGLAVWRLDH
ncbi:PQQ-like domain-containing protein [Micromonospora rhizosphaerae]|uniref:PQQ-like domain-containing protein n=1 Tax=Micromonospora rhizosphaerae TaxID=568872 RepID=A0A1C6RYF8_9ACTN|nr:PQQ-binding-like beta-propeller repeat protein [Micromonospora rhizosphaerae]SCL22187.1 PQQ-like domain-containing protein [Micromonospora rhizosphaerae]